MTKEELKAKIDALIGLESEMKKKHPGDAKLCYASPTGVVLFSVDIFSHSGNNWKFGGGCIALPDLWVDLCNAHREEKL